MYLSRDAVSLAVVSHDDRHRIYSEASFKRGWKMLHGIVKNYDERVVVEGGEVEVMEPPNPVEVLKGFEKS